VSSAAGGTRRAPAGARARLAALALFVAPMLAGCVNEAREKQLGAQIAANLNARVPLVQDVPLNLYVNDLGQLIARHSERPDLQYHFYIVDTDAVNAFALPGGYIYVDRGLIERTRSVSELSGVLAHEIAHVALRHGAKNLQRQMRTSSMSTVLYRTILGRDPLLDQQALQLGNQLWSAGHSRSGGEVPDRRRGGPARDAGPVPRADGGGAAGAARRKRGVVQHAPQHRAPADPHRGADQQAPPPAQPAARAQQRLVPALPGADVHVAAASAPAPHAGRELSARRTGLVRRKASPCGGAFLWSLRSSVRSG